MKCVLTILGAAMELLGLVLIVLDAREARLQAATVGTRTHRLHVTPVISEESAGAITARGGREPPSLPERVDQLEKALLRTRTELNDRISTVDVRAQDACSRAAADAKSHADDLDRRLRDVLGSAIGPGGSQIGALLFAIGVICSAAANLVD
jgi:hypothetical protein